MNKYLACPYCRKKPKPYRVGKLWHVVEHACHNTYTTFIASTAVRLARQWNKLAVPTLVARKKAKSKDVLFIS